jgi:aspartyl-tRNA(Asn)/glutamyl-tRNA(Gln) amidotransferase subunit B
MKTEGGDPEAIAKEKGMEQVSDTGALGEAVARVIAREERVVADYRAGKEAALQYLVGQGMKETRGAGNPGVIRELLIEALKV